MINQDFWSSKKVFVTGNTGFKGSWLTLWLKTLGANVRGYSLKPDTDPNLFEALKLDKLYYTKFADIRDLTALQEEIRNFGPDIVFHLAAQPLVRDSYTDPIYTFETNIIGTANLLEACRKSEYVSAINVITTDKCYENTESLRGYKETDRLGGHDPYSNSKACAELVTQSYRDSFFSYTNQAVATSRAGNVIGGGDWASDRLVPDIIRSVYESKKLSIRNPQSYRPWQHVFEPIEGYLQLTEMLYENREKYCQAWNFGPDSDSPLSVLEILNLFKKNLPDLSWDVDNDDHPHEANLLMLDISKVRSELEWKPKLRLDEAIQEICNWYINYYDNPEKISEYSIEEIQKFMDISC